MAEVYLAEAEGPGGFRKRLAIKRILPHLAKNQAFVELFFNEARLAAKLEHPNLVQVFEFGEIDGVFYLAMEYADGPSLRALLRRSVELRRPIPIGLAAKMVSLASEGLAYVHELCDGEGRPLGLVHRDVNPDNVLTSRGGAVKVADFGIAKAKEQSGLARAAAVTGKVFYMSPEQLMGEQVDRRADVYALGVVLYELLTWMVPFATVNQTELAAEVVGEAPAPVEERRPDCPPGLARIVERALAKSRRDRYPDCTALRADLERMLLERAELVSATEIARFIGEVAPPAIEPAKLATPVLVETTRLAARSSGRGLANALESPHIDDLGAADAAGNPRRCPSCDLRLAIAFSGALAVDGCESCGGLWLDSGELQALGNCPGGLASIRARFHPAGQPELRREPHPCPVCAKPLEPHELDSLRGIPLERCSSCSGVWLTQGGAQAVCLRLET